MATIPIEVIVQDAESPVNPTPTPVDPTDQGENTNITVPDTGVGTVDSNSNNIFTNSSVAISIVSIIIAVLAIGAVVALLVRKYHKRKTSEAGMTRQERKAMVATSTIAVLALTVLLGQLVIAGVLSPIATNAATDDTISDEADHIDVADKISIVVERTEDSEETIAKVTNTSYVTSAADFGYKVLLSMAEGVETSNLYLNGDEDSEYYIAPVNSEETEETETNIWGYALEEDGEYSAMPLLDDAIVVAQGDEPVEDEEIDIYYGVRVSSTLPAGIYSGGEIEYSLQASTGFPDSLVYMQDMTSEICAAAPTPGNSVTDPVPTATLEDIRDHNTYTIVKLTDGKCWMAQNLDLDIKTDGSIIYNSTNTNLTVAGSGAHVEGYTTENGIITWTPANATIDFTGSTVEGWSDSKMAPYSANPGDVYYYTSGSDENDTQYSSLAECVAAEHTAEDCKHYHAGNYYNWSAAVASNDSSSLTTQYDNAANSICPAGWRLPNGPSAENVNYNEMSNAIKSYGGILEGEIQESCGGWCNYYNYASDGFKLIRLKPIWLVRSGNIGNDLYNSRGWNMYFSRTVVGEDTVYSLNFSGRNIEPVRSTSRDTGYSVRCVAE